MEKPIIDDTFVLKKGNGKGAWTFVEMPVLHDVPKKRNSTLRVRGSIDAFELSDFHIWAMKKGTFLSVKADIRKAIRKQEGDTVRITLYLDEAPMVIPDDFLLCLQDEPRLLERFHAMPETEKRGLLDWIFSATTEQMKIERMGKAIGKLENAEFGK